MRQTLVTLPLRGEMLNKLREVDTWTILMQFVYPEVLKMAGKEVTGEDILCALRDGITTLEREVEPLVSLPIYGMIPRFIDAIVTDSDAAKEIKDHWEQSQKKQKRPTT